MLKPLLMSAAVAIGLTAVPALAQQKAPSAQEQASLQGLPVYSSDGQQIGQVTQVRVSGGQVNSVRAELSTTLGMGAKTVDIPATKFSQKSDRITLSMTADEASKLPAAK